MRLRPLTGLGFSWHRSRRGLRAWPRLLGVFVIAGVPLLAVAGRVVARNDRERRGRFVQVRGCARPDSCARQVHRRCPPMSRTAPADLGPAHLRPASAHRRRGDRPGYHGDPGYRSWLAGNWAPVRPLQAMTTAARNISAPTCTTAQPRRPGRRAQATGDACDDLLGRLDQSFQSQGQYVANASHELRTPHATMRVWLDVALGKPDPVPPHLIDLGGRLGRDSITSIGARSPPCPRPCSAAAGHRFLDASAGRPDFRRDRARQHSSPAKALTSAMRNALGPRSLATRRCSPAWSATSWTMPSPTTQRRLGPDQTQRRRRLRPPR